MPIDDEDDVGDGVMVVVRVLVVNVATHKVDVLSFCYCKHHDGCVKMLQHSLHIAVLSLHVRERKPPSNIQIYLYS